MDKPQNSPSLDRPINIILVSLIFVFGTIHNLSILFGAVSLPQEWVQVPSTPLLIAESFLYILIALGLLAGNKWGFTLLFCNQLIMFWKWFLPIAKSWGDSSFFVSSWDFLYLLICALPILMLCGPKCKKYFLESPQTTEHFCRSGCVGIIKYFLQLLISLTVTFVLVFWMRMSVDLDSKDLSMAIRGLGQWFGVVVITFALVLMIFKKINLNNYLRNVLQNIFYITSFFLGIGVLFSGSFIWNDHDNAALEPVPFVFSIMLILQLIACVFLARKLAKNNQ